MTLVGPSIDSVGTFASGTCAPLHPLVVVLGTYRSSPARARGPAIPFTLENAAVPVPRTKADNGIATLGEPSSKPAFAVSTRVNLDTAGRRTVRLTQKNVPRNVLAGTFSGTRVLVSETGAATVAPSEGLFDVGLSPLEAPP